MSILFSLIKDIFRNKSASGDIREIHSLSSAHPLIGVNKGTHATLDSCPSGNGNKFPTYCIDNDTDITNASSMLHIGGEETKPGWKILNIQPGDGVDYVGDINDLSQFPDGMFDIIYGSHVLEHVSQRNMLRTLSGLYRILSPNGKLMISVPDLEILCKLFVHPEIDEESRFHVMKMMFGGQTDPFDFHYIGLTHEFMLGYLGAANFKFVQRVNEFGIFNDASSYAPYGAPISLNLIAYKNLPQS